MTKARFIAGASIALALGSVSSSAFASSHREAPAIAQDQYADNTDVYAFISPENANNIVIVANYVPILLPSTGPNFYRFADSVLYEIRVDNDGDAVADISYQFTFRTTVARTDTFLYNDGPITGINPSTAAGGLNVGQTYTVRKVDVATGMGTDVVTNAATAPWFVGSRSFPAGGGLTSDQVYENVALQAVEDVTGGGKSFAGPRDEPFFVDLHVFDLLGVGGAPTTNGVNVMSIVLEVPISELTGGTRPAATAPAEQRIIGVYATASRQQVRILRRYRAEDSHGQFIQVSRLGWPLVNEAIVPLSFKDNFNRSDPAEDVSTIGGFVLNPVLPGLVNAVLFPTSPLCSANSDMENQIGLGFGGREYMVPLLAGAASNGGMPAAAIVPADLLRINVAAGQTFDSQNDAVIPALNGTAFPNGRQLADDVTLVALTAICNNPIDADLVPAGDVLDDAVLANDKAFTTTFPYLPTPHSGNPPAP